MNLKLQGYVLPCVPSQIFHPVLTEIMERNKSQLGKSDSYLCPQIDKMIGLLRRLENTAGDDFYKSIQYKKFAKGDFLLKEGEPCKQIWFLETGIARKFMNRNGAEPIGSFYFPGEFIVSNISTDVNSPSKTNIQFESIAPVYVLHINCLERLKIIYPVLFVFKVRFQRIMNGSSTIH